MPRSDGASASARRIPRRPRRRRPQRRPRADAHAEPDPHADPDADPGPDARRRPRPRPRPRPPPRPLRRSPHRPRPLRPGADPRPAPPPAPAAGAQAAIDFAAAQLGDAYRWGASGPDAWDCSGLTMRRLAGRGRRAAAQLRRAVRRLDADQRGPAAAGRPGLLGRQPRRRSTTSRSTSAAARSSTRRAPAGPWSAPRCTTGPARTSSPARDPSVGSRHGHRVRRPDGRRPGATSSPRSTSRRWRGCSTGRYADVRDLVRTNLVTYA